MKKKIYNFDGPFPSWRWESPEETLVREINEARQNYKQQPLKGKSIVGAANLYTIINKARNGK